MPDKLDGQPHEDEIPPEMAESYARLNRRRDRLENISVRLQLLKFAEIEDSAIALIVDEIIGEMEAFEYALRSFLEASRNSISDHSRRTAAADEFREFLAEVKNCQLLNAKQNAHGGVEDQSFQSPCVVMLQNCQMQCPDFP